MHTTTSPGLDVPPPSPHGRYTGALQRAVRALAAAIVTETGVAPAAAVTFAAETVLTAWARFRPAWFAGYCAERGVTAAEVLAELPTPVLAGGAV